MKKIIIACIILLSCASMASAQNNRAFKKGYQGDIEIGNYAVFGKDKAGAMVQVSTTHGYRTGTGMFLGLGVGFGYDMYIADPYGSAFMDAKYNFIDTKVSPFASARTGLRFGGFGSVEPFISIAGGVDSGRFSVKLGYDYGNVHQDEYLNGTRVSYFRKPSQLFCSFAVKF